MVEPVLFLSREAARLGTDRELRRRAARGEMHSVCTGAFVAADDWARLDTDARYRTVVRAAALLSRPDTQFSHDSAAAIWRLPTLGPWSTHVHELTPRMPGGTSRVGIRRHGLGRDPHGLHIDGVHVTSLARTVVDVASTSSFARAVVMADAALGVDGEQAGLPPTTLTKEGLLDLLSRLSPYPASTRARHALEFADGRSGSVAESFARAQFHAIGIPAPELQVPFADGEGGIGIVDFYWPVLGLVVEVDGRVKYGARRAFRTHVDPEQLLWEEKLREDRLRALVPKLVRLTWATIADRRRLEVVLAKAGLRR